MKERKEERKEDKKKKRKSKGMETIFVWRLLLYGF